MKLSAISHGQLGGQQRFPSFPFNYLEGRAEPQNSFVSNKLVFSIRIARPAIAPLHCFKMSSPSAKLPVLYNASLCLVVQGEKEVMLEDETYRYAASEFLVVSIDLPATGHVTVATPEKPYLCLQVDIDPKQLSDLVTETVRTEVHGAPTQRALFVGSTNDQLTDALL